MSNFTFEQELRNPEESILAKEIEKTGCNSPREDKPEPATEIT